MKPSRYFKYKSGYIYLIASETTLFKVGEAYDVDLRVEQLQKIADEKGLGKLSVIHAFQTDYPYVWESFFHELFSKYLRRAYGREWFELPSSEVKLFCKMPAVVTGLPNHFRTWYKLNIHRSDVMLACNEWAEHYSYQGGYLLMHPDIKPGDRDAMYRKIGQMHG